MGTCFSFASLLRHPAATEGGGQFAERGFGGRSRSARAPTAEPRPDPEVPEEDQTPPRANPREQALPWDMYILRQAEAVRPEGGGWVGENACAKGAAEGFRPDGPRTGSAGNLTASGNWTAGRGRNVGGKRWNVNVSTGRTPGHGKDTRRRNANVVRKRGRNSGGRKPQPHLLRRARGHAERGCRKFFVTGRAATIRRVLALIPAIATGRAPPPCIRPRTVNVSACGATVERADSNVLWSASRPATNAV